MDTVGMAIVGSAGVIGRRHISDLLQMNSANLIGIHDIDTEAAKAQAREHGVRFYQTMEDILLDEDVAAITIGIPHPLHHTIALQAFQAGKHVLTEKPITSSLTEADDMVAAARKAGVTLGVVFQHRFRPEIARMHELIEAGTLGGLYRTILVQAAFRSQFYYDSGGWRGTWGKEGGGVLINQSVHYLDLFQWLGGMPSVVHGLAGTLAHDIEVEDSASAVLDSGVSSDNGSPTLACPLPTREWIRKAKPTMSTTTRVAVSGLLQQRVGAESAAAVDSRGSGRPDSISRGTAPSPRADLGAAGYIVPAFGYAGSVDLSVCVLRLFGCGTDQDFEY